MGWQMINKHEWIFEKDGYVIQVKPPKWWVIKDGNVIDIYYRYSPTNGELSARIQAEKCLDKILNNHP